MTTAQNSENQRQGLKGSDGNAEEGGMENTTNAIEASANLTLASRNLLIARALRDATDPQNGQERDMLQDAYDMLRVEGPNATLLYLSDGYEDLLDADDEDAAEFACELASTLRQIIAR